MGDRPRDFHALALLFRYGNGTTTTTTTTTSNEEETVMAMRIPWPNLPAQLVPVATEAVGPGFETEFHETCEDVTDHPNRIEDGYVRNDMTRQLVMAAISAFGGTAVAQTLDEQQKNCRSPNLDLRIDACTAVIRSGQVQGERLASVLGNRLHRKTATRSRDPGFQRCPRD
jgi:hypothetical protein